MNATRWTSDSRSRCCSPWSPVASRRCRNDRPTSSTASSIRSTPPGSVAAWWPLRTDGRLWDLAGDRAAAMASHNVLSHTVAGALGTSLTATRDQLVHLRRDDRLHARPAAFAAADALVKLWRNSPEHWALLMSDPLQLRRRRAGATARRNRRTFASIVLTESPRPLGPARVGHRRHP